MALFHWDFVSETLRLSTSVTLIFPDRPLADIRARGSDAYRYPVLYLLHGMSDNHTIWQRRTSIERYVDPLGVAVVMPAVDRSFYADMAMGNNYWTFISQELPDRLAALFPISTERDDTFVAGLSMGGYGAFKLALSQPERFAAAASLSGALDILDLAASKDPGRRREMRAIFGKPGALRGGPNDLLALAEEVAASGGPKPSLYHWCGTEDTLITHNRRFYEHVTPLDFDLTYEEGPGDHTWGYWDSGIQRVLEWLPLERRAPFLPEENE